MPLLPSLRNLGMGEFIYPSASHCGRFGSSGSFAMLAAIRRHA